jgi:ABC-type sugar transport system substrate-binding protein
VTEAVSAAVAKHPEARAVVLADALVAAGAGEALRAPGRLVISAVRAAVTDEALRRGTLDAIVAADECTELRQGVRLAIAAAENDATRLQPAITLPAQVLRSGSGPAGCPPG